MTGRRPPAPRRAVRAGFAIDASRIARRLRIPAPILADCVTIHTASLYPLPVISYPEDGNALYRQLEEDSFWFRHRNECLLAALRRLPPDGAVYDVGGGNGFVARALQDAGYDTTLVEPGPVGAENARQQGVKKVIEATLEDAALDEGTLPAIGIFDVLEHMPDEAAFLDELHRHLRPGGRLYLTVPAYAALWSGEDEFAGHFRRYGRRGLSAALHRAGFDVEYLSHFFWLLPLPILLFRALPSRLGFHERGNPAAKQREHGAGGGIASRILAAALAWEPRAVAAGRTLPFGGSLLCVARSRAAA